jgi:Holliday junction resolvasome RuvABC endonuclease subunit
MRIIGVDPSSTVCGIAVVDTPRTVVAVDHWERDRNSSHPERLVSYYNWLQARLLTHQPDMAVVEMLGVERNAIATRKISYYQGVSALTCKLSGLMVIEARVSTVRKIVLGNGNMSKDEAWSTMRAMHPNLFSAKNAGGADEMDALVLALAGISAAER